MMFLAGGPYAGGTGIAAAAVPGGPAAAGRTCQPGRANDNALKEAAAGNLKTARSGYLPFVRNGERRLCGQDFPPGNVRGGAEPDCADFSSFPPLNRKRSGCITAGREARENDQAANRQGCGIAWQAYGSIRRIVSTEKEEPSPGKPGSVHGPVPGRSATSPSYRCPVRAPRGGSYQAF
jgi:hypothetical protein